LVAIRTGRYRGLRAVGPLTLLRSLVTGALERLSVFAGATFRRRGLIRSFSALPIE
jgi:hypothetical protein